MCFFLMHYIIRSRSKSSIYHGFGVMMHIHALSKFLSQMKCDMRVSLIIICAEVMGTTKLLRFVAYTPRRRGFLISVTGW